PLPLLVGFAAESDRHLEEGRRKLAAKNLNLLVVNDILRPDAGFAADTNQVTILAQEAEPEALPLLSKEETAHRLLDRLRRLL
ncbi:MAG: bifunctional 4'-phosphopantothenoylcysteine decarboxylase/phosphopantothenoylcysteine synthetase, partial [Desulfobacteraceae bacterium]|nr:bifunctional 4'-phosphopantothenoylcysteine decarboxylase/phosphopantothenoylcysteine synthetase [Desulfobacteraceae bacterium]